MEKDTSEAEEMVNKITEAMEKPACKMISALIICGYICAGEDNALNPKNNNALDSLLNASKEFPTLISTIIQTNYFVWSVSHDIREELFQSDELAIDSLMPIVAGGGMSWYGLIKSSALTKEEFTEFFIYLKNLFILCSNHNSGENEYFDAINNALDGIIAL